MPFPHAESVQFESHPSPSVVLPSSHFSVNDLRPSPHRSLGAADSTIARVVRATMRGRQWRSPARFEAQLSSWLKAALEHDAVRSATTASRAFARLPFESASLHVGVRSDSTRLNASLSFWHFCAS